MGVSIGIIDRSGDIILFFFFFKQRCCSRETRKGEGEGGRGLGEGKFRGEGEGGEESSCPKHLGGDDGKETEKNEERKEWKNCLEKIFIRFYPLEFDNFVVFFVLFLKDEGHFVVLVSSCCWDLGVHQLREVSTPSTTD